MHAPTPTPVAPAPLMGAPAPRAPAEPDLPATVAQFRAGYRARIPARYRGWAHFAFTSVASLAVIGLALTRLDDVAGAEWAVVPATLVLANVVEYLGHRLAMHRPRPGLGLVYRRHTLEHHHFFTHEAMAYAGARDFIMVLFPPSLLLFFLGAIATPLGALVFLAWSPDAGWLFVATAMGYFLTYEWLHFGYHLPQTHPLLRVRGFRALRRHHAAHHDLRLMGRYNFNLTLPICDVLLGTRWRGGAPPAPRPR